MNKRLRDLLWILSLAIMLLLFVQTQWQPIPLSRLALKNDPMEYAEPEWSWQNYRDGVFQTQAETYLREHFAFREFGLRTYNQYGYFLWKKTCNSFFYPGRDHWMYYRPGVLDYYGQEAAKVFDSEEEMNQFVDREVDMMNELRDILKQDHGIELLSFIAPDKAFIYPEHLPRLEADTTVGVAARRFAQRFSETGFPNIDMTRWYATMADTSSRLLFMPMDTHWTFASYYGYDSLFRLMDQLNGFGIPRMRLDSISERPYPGRQDDEQTLNLLFKVRNDTPEYIARVSVEADSTSRKPKVLFVGDSFIFALECLMPVKELLSYYENWFYYDKVFKGFGKREYKVGEINRLRSLLNVDYVVVYSVGYQWCRGTNGFVEDALQSIKDPEQVKVALVMNELEAKPQMMQMIEEKAQAKGVSIEEMLELDARWIIEHEGR